MSRFFEQAMLTILLVASSFCSTACSNLAADRSLPASEEQEPAGAVVARIDGQPIHLRELDRWLKDDWLRKIGKDPAELYQLHRAGLEGVIGDRLIDRAAASEGLSADAYLDKETAALGLVTNDEVDRFYERYRDRITPVESLEQLHPKIRKFLVSDDSVRVVTALRREADIEILLIQPRPPPVERYRVPAGGASRGPADAPVTIVEFSDYQCGYCQRAEATLRELDQLFPGKLRFVYRHLPLDFHKNALPAAKAAVCAERQSRFWDYHDLLFANQRSLFAANLLQYAEQIGLDSAAFQTCLEADGTRQRIEEDVAAAAALGARATPTFFINGILLHGAQDLQTFQSIVERELAATDHATQ